MQEHFQPKFKLNQFTCMHCGVNASQRWADCLVRDSRNGWEPHDALMLCKCFQCRGWSYWYRGEIMFPSDIPVPSAHNDTPQDCKADYDEAREVVARSPKAASALLRLALQKLMVALGEKGKNINDDIESLVAKGLPVQIQQALDFCRVVGNNAVHPGEINLDDTPEIAHQLFTMLNFIVEDRIARPKQVAEYYSQLPESARENIEKRDRPVT